MTDWLFSLANHGFSFSGTLLSFGVASLRLRSSFAHHLASFSRIYFLSFCVTIMCMIMCFTQESTATCTFFGYFRREHEMLEFRPDLSNGKYYLGLLCPLAARLYSFFCEWFLNFFSFEVSVHDHLSQSLFWVKVVFGL